MEIGVTASRPWFGRNQAVVSPSAPALGMRLAFFPVRRLGFEGQVNYTAQLRDRYPTPEVSTFSNESWSGRAVGRIPLVNAVSVVMGAGYWMDRFGKARYGPVRGGGFGAFGGLETLLFHDYVLRMDLAGYSTGDRTSQGVKSPAATNYVMQLSLNRRWNLPWFLSRQRPPRVASPVASVDERTTPPAPPVTAPTPPPAPTLRAPERVNARSIADVLDLALREAQVEYARAPGIPGLARAADAARLRLATEATRRSLFLPDVYATLVQLGLPGIQSEDPATYLRALSQAREVMTGEDSGRPAADRFAFQLRALLESFRIFQITDPVEKLQGFRELAIGFSPPLARALDGDLSTRSGRAQAELALQGIFRRLRTGLMSPSDLGITGEEFVNLAGQLQPLLGTKDDGATTLVPEAPAKEVRPAKTSLVVLASVNFASGSSALSREAQRALGDVARSLATTANAGVRVRLVAHTDATGSRLQNQRLARARGDAVARYLTSRGVPRANVRVELASETEPVASNRTAEGRASNRRVSIVLDR